MKQKLRIAVITVVSTVVLAAGAFAAGGAEGSAEGNMTKSGYPIAKETVTYEVMASVREEASKSYNEMEFFKEYEEVTNVHIEWLTYLQPTYGENAAVVLASGDLPDAFYGGWSVPGNILELGSDGTYVMLDDLIDEWMPNLKKTFNQTPWLRPLLTQRDGHLYTLPKASAVPANRNNGATYINTKWLSELGLSMPKTVDEFYSTLKAFKANFPENPPFTFVWGHGTMGPFNFLWGSFGTTYWPGNPIFANGKTLVWAPATEEFRAAIQFWRKLYAEGLIDPAVFTHSRAEYRAKKRDVDVGVYCDWSAYTQMEPEKTKPDYYDLLLPPEGPADKQVWQHNVVIAGTSTTAFAITNEADNPVILARWIDRSFDPDIGYISQMGWLGERVKKNAEGKYYTDDVGHEGNLQAWRHLNAPGILGVFAIPGPFLSQKTVLSEAGQAKADNTEALSEFFNEFAYPGDTMLSFTDEEAEKISTIRNDIGPFTQEAVQRWIMEGGIESEWDSFRAQLDRMGLKDYIEIYQKAYDAYLENL